MSHGGRRQGAGRPIGTGSPLLALKNARAADKQQSVSYLRDLIGTDDDPARIALSLAKDPSVDTRLRIDCAVALMPFVHPKLSYTELKATHTSVTASGEAVLLELEARLNRIGQTSPVIDAAPAEADDQSEAELPENGGFLVRFPGTTERVSAPCPQIAALAAAE